VFTDLAVADGADWVFGIAALAGRRDQHAPTASIITAWRLIDQRVDAAHLTVGWGLPVVQVALANCVFRDGIAGCAGGVERRARVGGLDSNVERPVRGDAHRSRSP
jgi:hypothetical protein